VSSRLGDTQWMAEAAQKPRSGRSGKALLLTILGEFVLPNGGTVWTSTLIKSLGQLGMTESNARQAAARLAEDTIVTPVRVGRATRWELTDRGQRLLTDGAHRIYEFGATSAEWDRQWVLVVAPVPEELRAKRLLLRNQLGFAGFGFVNAGFAISPHTERLKVAESILASLDIDPVPLVFVANHSETTPDEEIIKRAWDLDALERSYRGFLHEFTRARPTKGPACFSSLVELVHEWRRFPFEDPEIPPELLSNKWPGERAKAVFDEFRAQWSPTAQEWFRNLDSENTTKY
jgi:phenylacetic acid degradation operon negative regulatory protein